ncbi:TIGR03086 family metal-binding protein [Streptomyces sp. I05A-00742]|uniref:TIGR03086 family metal-binding protein n=1 Tax=Streptomyces sp. I05A-00742 TaxID=2732853 RepID=UPI00289D980F|nr:TIGR03086 family metal-binding protein [Streptomyces sp. I05A-00742]
MQDIQNDQDPRPQLRRAVAQLNAVAAQVRPDRLDAATPCGEYDVRGLLGHLVGVARALAEATGEGEVRRGDDRPPRVADDAWPAAVEESCTELVDAWRDEARLTEPFDAPWGKVPGHNALRFIVMELVVHAWDLNEALGRPAALDPELSEYALATAERLPAEGRPGAFAAARPAPEGADAHVRLAARTGRAVETTAG